MAHTIIDINSFVMDRLIYTLRSDNSADTLPDRAQQKNQVLI